MKKCLTGCAVVMTIGVLAGCSDAPRAHQATVVRDSAGVEIVSNPGIEGLPACNISQDPVFSVGEVDGEPEQELYRVFGAARLRDGQVVVANQGSGELRFFSGDGAFLRTVGREGSGPGEFRRLRQLIRHRNDSLIAWDGGLQRWIPLGPGGGMGPAVTLQRPFPNAPLLLGMTFDGTTWATYHDFQVPTGAQYIEQPMLLLRFAGDGSVLDTVGVFNYGSMRVIDPEARMVGGPQFETRQRFAKGDDWFLTGNGATGEVEVRNTSWELERLIRWETGDRRVTDADIRTYREERMAGVSGEFATVMEKQLDITPFADAYPAFQELAWGAEALWVKRYPRPGTDDRWWLRFDREGVLSCQVTLPRTFRPTQFGTDFVLGIDRDAEGVERVLQYRWELP